MRWAATALVALVGCGTSHSPTDAGPPDAGPAHLCPHLSAEEGRACDPEAQPAICYPGYDHFCAVRIASCVDGVTAVLEHAWGARLEGPLSCASGERTALMGEGPSGAFVLTGSAASHAGGFTSDTKLLFTPGGPVDACESPRLVVYTFRPPPGEDPSYVVHGEQPTRGRLTVGDVMHEVTGTIVFEREDPVDPGRELEGTLHLEGESFTVDGPFHVFGCERLAGINI